MKKLILSLTLTALSPLGFASVSSVDWKTTNDALLSYDSQSGLYWLDLTYTESETVSQVNNRLNNTDLTGFRYATIGEVIGLFANAGITVNNDSVAHSSGEKVQFANLINLLGATQISGSVFRSIGVTGTTQGANFLVSSLYLDQSTSRTNASIDLMNIGLQASATGGFDATTKFGHFLVTEPISNVPLPSMGWLFFGISLIFAKNLKVARSLSV